MELPFAESWKIKMIEPIRKSTRQEREEWIKEAHELGLKVNGWTSDDDVIIKKLIEMNVDFITTNKPVEAEKLARKF